MGGLLFLGGLGELNPGIIIGDGLDSELVLDSMDLVLEQFHNLRDWVTDRVLRLTPLELREVSLNWGFSVGSPHKPVVRDLPSQIAVLFVHLLEEALDVAFEFEHLVIAEHEGIKVTMK